MTKSPLSTRELSRRDRHLIPWSRLFHSGSKTCRTDNHNDDVSVCSIYNAQYEHMNDRTWLSNSSRRSGRLSGRRQTETIVDQHFLARRSPLYMPDHTINSCDSISNHNEEIFWEEVKRGIRGSPSSAIHMTGVVFDAIGVASRNDSNVIMVRCFKR